MTTSAADPAVGRVGLKPPTAGKPMKPPTKTLLHFLIMNEEEEEEKRRGKERKRKKKGGRRMGA